MKATMETEIKSSLISLVGEIDAQTELIVRTFQTIDLMYFIELSTDGTNYIGRYSIRSIFQHDSKRYLIVQVPDDWWDPEEQEAPQCLLRFNNDRLLSTLAPDEFEQVSKAYSNLSEWQNSWPGKMQDQELASQVECTFGKASA